MVATQRSRARAVPLAAGSIGLALAGLARPVAAAPSRQDPQGSRGSPEPAAAATAAEPEIVALVGGTVHSMIPGDEPRRAVVLASAGRIHDVLDDAAGSFRAPSGVRVIDVAGLHLVPGLIDAMVGFDPEHDPLYLAHGVTTVRDLGNDAPRVIAWRAPESRDRGPGPALFTSGAVFDGEPRSTLAAFVARTPDEAQQGLALLMAPEVGADVVAFLDGIPEPSWRKLIELAHASGRQIWGPLPEGVSLAAALDAGQDGLLYLDWALAEGVGWRPVQELALEPSVAAAAAAGVRVTPLLNTLTYRLRDPAAEDPWRRYLNPIYDAQWSSELALRQRIQSEDPDFLKTGERVLAKQRAFAKRLADSGVRLVPGSGAPHPWLLPGRSLIQELESWEAAGIAPAEVLRLATDGAAQALGLGGRGRIAPGASADIVALAEDPTLGLRAFHGVRGVLLRGRWLPRAEIDQSLESLAASQAARGASEKAPLAIAEPTHPQGEVLLAGQVETRLFGRRTAGERYTVVRDSEGRVAVCGRKLILSDQGGPERELETVQVLRGGRLEEFLVVLRKDGQELLARGLRVGGDAADPGAGGGRFHVERRVNDVFISSATAKEDLSAVAHDTVTTLLVIGQIAKEQRLAILALGPGLEPEVVGWDLVFGPGGAHMAWTHRGVSGFGFERDGALKFHNEQIGSQPQQTLSVAAEPGSAGGFLLPEFKWEITEEQFQARIQALDAGAAAPVPGVAAPVSGGAPAPDASRASPVPLPAGQAGD